VSLGQWRGSGHRTLDTLQQCMSQGTSLICRTRLKLRHHRHGLGGILTDTLDNCTGDKKAESTAISIKKFDCTDYKTWTLEVDILFEQKQVLGIVDGTDEAPDANNATKFKAWKRQHGIVQSTILLVMERSLQQQYGVQKDAKALCDQLKEDYKSKVKLNVWALRDEMSAVRLGDCENVQEYSSTIQSYVNDFSHCADTDSSSSTGSGMMPKSEHTYYLMKGVPKDDDWRIFTQLMYDKIDTLADKLEEIVTKMKAHEVRHQQEVDLASIELLALAKPRTKSEMRSSMHSRKSRKSRDSGSEGDGSSSESKKHCRRHTQECYRCHKVGHIARYCPSTAPVERAAPTETVVAATTMTRTSIGNYWITVTNGESPSKESWYLDCATTTHICGDRQKLERYTEYTKRGDQEIRDFAGRVASKAIGHRDVRLRLRLPGGRNHIHEVVVRNVLHVEGAHNLLSQSRLMDRGLWIVPVNGYGIKIYHKLLTDSALGQCQGRGQG
jgi:hypothetical protein